MSKPITVVRSLMGYLSFVISAVFICLLLLGWVTQTGHRNLGLRLIVVSVGIWILSVVFVFWQKTSRIKARVRQLQAYAAAKDLTYDASDTPLTYPHFMDMSLPGLNKEKYKAYELHNLISAPDWQYADFSYKQYGHTKYGDYVAATVYYGVMSAELPRALPNVFFDSKQARGKQFDRLFKPSQEHSLEGDFDNFFVTYFPAQYTIDSMSFISPDVMIALRDAAQYDIEIAGNRLFLYAPLEDPATQLDDMAKNLHAIKQQLLDNILTYRDERLPYAQGRQRVTPLGAALQRRRPSIWATVAIILFYIAVFYGQSIWNSLHNR